MNWYKRAKEESPEPEREYPVAAAILASGKIFTGRHHGEALEKAKAAGLIRKDKDGYTIDTEGNYLDWTGATDLFITNKGRIIDRLESRSLGEVDVSEAIPEKEREDREYELV